MISIHFSIYLLLHMKNIFTAKVRDKILIPKIFKIKVLI
jgi:hypothetical protein